MAERVVILGGGVGGMSAAHELGPSVASRWKYWSFARSPGGRPAACRSAAPEWTGVLICRQSTASVSSPASTGISRTPSVAFRARRPARKATPVMDPLVEAAQMQFARRKGRPAKFELNTAAGSAITNSFWHSGSCTNTARSCTFPRFRSGTSCSGCSSCCCGPMTGSVTSNGSRGWTSAGLDSLREGQDIQPLPRSRNHAHDGRGPG